MWFRSLRRFGGEVGGVEFLRDVLGMGVTGLEDILSGKN